MHQAEGRPDRVIATHEQGVPRAAPYGCHPAPIGFNTRGLGIVTVTAGKRSPVSGVQLEVGAAPFSAHRPEDAFQPALRFGMSSIQGIPRAKPPASEPDPI